MSLPSHAHERETEFLVSLRDELANGPSAATCRRQIAAAASEARRISRVKRLELGGLSALVVAVLLLGGTSRVAVAGSLPHRVQGLVAEAARLLPVPIPVPFPTTAGMPLPQAPILDATAVLAWGGDDDRDREGASDRDENLSWGDRDWGSGHEERNPQDDWRRDGDRS